MKKCFLSFFAITMMIATSIQAQIPTNGLVAYYPFNGNANDSSGNGNNGTVNGATLTSDRFGNAKNAFVFNGKSDYIQIKNNTLPIGNSSRTISSWFYLTPTLGYNDWYAILSYGNSLNNGYLNDFLIDTSHVDFNCHQFFSLSNNLLSISNNWHNITVTYDSSKLSNVRIYLDAKLLKTNINNLNAITKLNTQLTNLLIGKSNIMYASYYYFNGKIDDVRIYNRTLDSSEVIAIYNEGGYSLPVTIDIMKASQKDNLVGVVWSTVTEVNTNNFNIQHSNNGKDFIVIGSVKAIGSGANSYSFSDDNPINGINYYRLQSVDKDGSSTFSKVVSINFGDNQIFSIAPNPAKDYATISFSKTVDKASIAVYNMTGKQVITKSLKASTNTYKLNTQSLKSGLYVIKVNTETGNYNDKLLINK